MKVISENIVRKGNTLLKTFTETLKKMCEIYFHDLTKKKELITLGAQHSVKRPTFIYSFTQATIKFITLIYRDANDAYWSRTFDAIHWEYGIR